ncbi:MAG: KEOPS complex subunit Cgi121 [Promethearchaeota archaeon]
MIVKGFNIKVINLHFFVGINQIRLDYDKFISFSNIHNKRNALDYFFAILEEIQNKNKNTIIQFIKEKYILNQDHIFTPCYYAEKSFLQKTNISNKKNIELLLYLATNRQINKSIDAFGIDNSDLKKKILTYCIISPLNNFNKINDELISALNAEQKEMTINNLTDDKINLIKEYFELSDNQINSVLKSYGIIMSSSESNLKCVKSALYDLICEKMALLHIEK